MPKPSKKKQSLAQMQAAANKFHESYIQSPKYLERLKKQKYSQPEKVVADRLASMKATRVIDNPYVATQYHGHKTPNDKFITYNTEQIEQSGFLRPTETLVHEYSHSAGGLEKGQDKNGNLNLNDADIRELVNRNKFSKITDEQLRKHPIEVQAHVWHEKKASENKASLDMFRYMLKKDGIYDAGRQDFDQNLLKRAKEKYKGEKSLFNFLFNNYSDKDIIWLMNNIAKVNANQSNNENLA